MIRVLAQHYNFAIVIILMMIGLYVVFSSRNMIRKLVGLGVFQTSVFMLYISMGKVTGGQPPIIRLEKSHDGDHAMPAGDAQATINTDPADAGHEAVSLAAEAIYSNPLPHVLILTAIVVGVATLAIGLALVVRIREAYGTIEEDEIDRLDYQGHLERVTD